jgi:hypothetical protein
VGKTKSELATQARAADDCLDSIKKTLEDLGVDMVACPPMFYPEAVSNLATWTARASRECQAAHGWHGGDEAAVAACLRAWIVGHQKDGKA